MPIEFGAAREGSRAWETTIPVDPARGLRVMVFGPDAAGWKHTLETPGGGQVRLDDPVPPSTIVRSVDQRGVRYAVQNLLSGTATFHIEAPAGAIGGDPHFLLIDDGAPYAAYTHLKSFDLVAGSELSFVTFLCDAVPPAQRGDAPPTPLADRATRAEIHLRLPDGSEIVVPMRDDGGAADETRGDGKLTGSVRAELPGAYTARVVVDGTLPDGRRVRRTSQHLIAVAPGAATIGRDGVAADDSSGALRVDIPVSGVAWTDKLQIAAEVWGRGPTGDPVPVCWVGGMVENDPLAEFAQASLRVDKRWLARAGASAPLELRNARVQDPETHIPIARQALVPVRSEGLDLKDVSFDGVIDDAMRRGLFQPRRALPARIAGLPRAAPRAFGAHNLMLVHGYCSQFPLWPTDDFDGFIELFQDPGQNRSHDEFAQLLLATGNQSKSFGVVAHSQGGAAALQLYTYYWSGLDWAEGPRLIQSLGTPYQGTPLAGDVAVLGDIFGTGCGTNFDLSPEGAALWLAGIPSANRSRVHYWTTSFLDDFGFDFCNFVTDFLLSDPDDGVIERSRGQLPGANNMGHTEGQCHTSGMRDPAQYLDTGRNIDMNANAAR